MFRRSTGNSRSKADFWSLQDLEYAIFIIVMESISSPFYVAFNAGWCPRINIFFCFLSPWYFSEIYKRENWLRFSRSFCTVLNVFNGLSALVHGFHNMLTMLKHPASLGVGCLADMILSTAGASYQKYVIIICTCYG